MAEKRKLAKDWRTSYENAQIKLTKIENQIKERLVELCRLHPDVEVGRKIHLTQPILYAKDILKTGNLSTDGMLNFIDIIEKWLAAQHPHQQSEIEFKDGGFDSLPEPKEFIEYKDNDDDYDPPIRKEVTEIHDIRLYCMHEGCNKYIKGKEGYNGAFTAETGQRCDLRNQGFKCKEHSE